MEVTGVLVVDKPAGPTSFEVVQRVRRLLRAEKAGHTGTLDPAATGVLAICLGEAVKLQQYLALGDKAYEAMVAFGISTDTEDAEGKVLERGDPSGLDAATVEIALERFRGEIAQTPPMYSAVRVRGRRLHEMARAGESLDRAPRRVRIDFLALLSFEPAHGGRALARLALRCSKGTYVRTLAADLGRALGVPAHLAALRRTAAGPFEVATALSLEEAETLAHSGRLAERLVSLEASLGSLPTVRLSVLEARQLVHGRAIPAPSLPPGIARALDSDGRLLAVCQVEGGVARPARVFAPRAIGASRRKD